MIKNLSKTLLSGFLFSFFFSNVFAQQTLIDTDPLSIFKKGTELFENNQFAAAQGEFNRYLRSGDNNQTLRSDAEYYIAVSAMELYQDDAESLLNRFTEQYPESPKARLVSYYLGTFQFRQKEYKKALSSLENVDVSDLSQKQLSEYRFMLGYSYFKNNDLKKAKEMLAQVKDVENENQSIASYYYGYISYVEGNYKDALAEFNKLKDDKKFKTLIPVYLAQIYLLQGKYDKVIETGEAAFNDSASRSGNDLRLYVAEAYFMNKDYSKAAENYLAYGGQLTDHHLYQLGYSLLQLKQYQDAIKYLAAIPVKEDSLGQNISYNLAGAYLEAGDKDKARTRYDFASRLKFIPSIQEKSLLNFAKLSYELNYENEATESFKKYLKLYPSSSGATDAKELLGQILLAANNPVDALPIIESISNRTPKLNEAYQKILYYYGIDLFNKKDYKSAEDYFSKSLKQPVDKKVKALAYFWLGESEFKNGQIAEALDDYKNFLYIDEAKQTPYFNAAYYNIGYCFFSQEKYVEAKSYFNNFINYERNNSKSARYTDAVLRAADCSFVLKDYDEALRGYSAIIDSRAQDADYAMYQKGIIQGLTRDNEGKIATLRQLVKTFPSTPYVDDALFAIAETYNGQRNFEQAIKEFQSLNYNYPKSPYYRVALLNIGQDYINLDQDNKAIPIFKTIVKLYPYSDEAKQAVRSIQNSYVDRGLTDSLDAFIATMPQGSLVVNTQDSILYASAFSNIKSGDCSSAIKSLEKYLSKYPNGYFVADANYYLGECRLKSNDPSKALGNFNTVVAKSPNSYVERAAKYSAEIYFDQKNYDFALKRYQQLEEIAVVRQNVLIALLGELRSYYLLNNYDKTLETGNKILTLGFADDPSRLEAQFYIGKAQLALNQLDQAAATFKQVYASDKTEKGAEAMYQLGYIYFLQEKLDQSQKTIYELKDKFPTYDYWKAKGFILLADIFVKQGDYFQAKSTLQSIIDRYKGPELKEVAQGKLKEIEELEKNKQPDEKDK